jgi:hypothetical protein
MMQIVTVTARMCREEANSLKGGFLSSRHFDRLIGDTTTVFKPDGSPLLIYIRDGLRADLCRSTLHRVKQLPIGWTDARGYAAGGQPFQRRLADGTLSRTKRWRRMNSGEVGFLDRDKRNPYCRKTTLTRDHAGLRALAPLAEAVSGVLQQHAPIEWERQRAFVEQVHPDFKISGTVFTTITVNVSERTAAHTDSNDFRGGLGAMCVLEDGNYVGGELVFPRYGVAVDMRRGGVCLADVHEVHGNARFDGEGTFNRFAFIFYAREHMDECDSMNEERLQLARRLSKNAAIRGTT